MSRLRRCFNLPPTFMERCIAVSKAETEMYLRIAEGFADEGNEEMAEAVFGYAAQAIEGKRELLRQAQQRKVN